MYMHDNFTTNVFSYVNQCFFIIYHCDKDIGRVTKGSWPSGKGVPGGVSALGLIPLGHP